MVKKLQTKRSFLGTLTGAFLALAGFTSLDASAQYCTPTFSSGCNYGDGINDFKVTQNGVVIFEHLDSGCSPAAYGDFTSQTISVEAGQTYSFTSITNGEDGQRLKIWVDFDNNQTFEESEQLAFISGGVIANGTFVISETIPTGQYRLRVASRYYNSLLLSPCNNTAYGEAHDYTLSVVNNVTCLSPTDSSVSNITAFTADLSWTVSGTPESYVVEYGTNGFSLGSGTTVTTTESSYQLTGLSQNTQYQYYVKSICTMGDESVFAGPFSFTTLYTCPAPTQLEVSNVTASSATLTWQYSGDGTNFEVEYGQLGFTVGTGTVQTTTTNTVTLSGLTDWTNYQVYVREICSASDTSPNSAAVSFLTLSNPVPSPWNENFNSLVLPFSTSSNNVFPNGWTHSSFRSVTSQYTRVITGADGNYVDVNLYGSTSKKNGWIQSRPVTVQAGDSLKLKYALRGWNSDDTVGGDLQVKIVLEDNSEITLGTVTYDEPTPWTELSYSLDDYAGQILQVKIVAQKASGSHDFLLGLDDFEIRGCTPGVAPTGETNQTVDAGTTLAQLNVTGTELKWYADQDLNNQLADTTAVVNGTTYYVTQTVNGCESNALAVTVEVTLSNDTLDLAELKLFPNPTTDVLNISYKNEVANVTIFDIQGRQVATHNVNATNAVINVTDLATGTYLIKIETTSDEVSTLKFIKK